MAKVYRTHLAALARVAPRGHDGGYCENSESMARYAATFSLSSIPGCRRRLGAPSDGS